MNPSTRRQPSRGHGKMQRSGWSGPSQGFVAGGRAAAIRCGPSRAQASGIQAAPKAALGRSQVVRQRILIPPSPGSNPGAPASAFRRTNSDVTLAKRLLSPPAQRTRPTSLFLAYELRDMLGNLRQINFGEISESDGCQFFFDVPRQDRFETLKRTVVAVYRLAAFPCRSPMRIRRDAPCRS